jgi:hypothetical protein
MHELQGQPTMKFANSLINFTSSVLQEQEKLSNPNGETGTSALVKQQRGERRRSHPRERRLKQCHTPTKKLKELTAP